MGWWLCGGFLSRLAVAALGHNGIVEAASEAFWELIKLVIAVNFDGFLGGIHHHMAFVAPMEMLIQFHSQVVCDLTVQVIGQLF
jgi:hypothetical protein